MVSSNFAAMFVVMMYVTLNQALASSPTPVPTTGYSITFFNAGSTNGDLQGQKTADSTCASAVPSPPPSSWLTSSCTTVKALISGNQANMISLPPTPTFASNTYVYGPTGMVISYSWPTLFNQNGANGTYTQPSLVNSLYAANVVSSRYWWTGTGGQGKVSGTPCSPGSPKPDWTGTENMQTGHAFTGIIGDAMQTNNANWYGYTSGDCTKSYQLVCACFGPLRQLRALRT